MRNLPIAYGNSCFAKMWTNKMIDWATLCERLKTTVRTTETVEEYPKMSKADRDRAKDKGGFVGGSLKDNRRKRETVVCRSMLTLDADNAETGFIDRFVAGCDHAACVYTTHGHRPEAPRCRIVVPFTRDVTADEYVAIARYYAEEWGIDQFDECSYRPHQLMYWPTTPANGEFICKTIDGEWLDPDVFLGKHPYWRDCSLLPTSSRESSVRETSKKPQEDPLSKSGVVGAFCRTYSITAAIDAFLSDVYTPSIIEGRYDFIAGEGTAGVVVYDDKYAYSHHATDPACGKLLNAFDLVRIHLFGDDDEKKTFKEMSEFAAQDEQVKLLLLEERCSNASSDFGDDDESWKKKLEYESKSAVLKNTLRNLTLILENDVNLKSIVFNELYDGMEIKGPVPWRHRSRYWRDADDAQLISYIDETYGTFSKRNYDVAVSKVTDDRSYHPIREYLDSLPEWDGIKRVETLLIDYLGANNCEYVKMVTRKTLCAAVMRIRIPGIKFDSMLVLNGPQGIGKSTLISKLAGEWFSDSLSLSDTKDKTAAEKLQGYWILEIGELAGLRKAETETLRSFLSRQNDIYRAAFGKRATPHPRQCVFFGTTNAENGYLRDITGNRRFWPVKTPGGGSKNSWQMTKDEIDQIWAEVCFYVDTGETLELPKEIEAKAKNEQREAMEADEREGLVSDYLETLLPVNWDEMDLFERRSFLDGTSLGEIGKRGSMKRTSVSNIEIWCECFQRDRASIKRSDSNELAAILTRLGWVRKEDKERTRLYGPQYVFVPKVCIGNIGTENRRKKSS